MWMETKRKMFTIFEQSLVSFRFFFFFFEVGQKITYAFVLYSHSLNDQLNPKPCICVEAPGCIKTHTCWLQYSRWLHIDTCMVSNQWTWKQARDTLLSVNYLPSYPTLLLISLSFQPCSCPVWYNPVLCLDFMCFLCHLDGFGLYSFFPAWSAWVIVKMMKMEENGSFRWKHWFYLDEFLSDLARRMRFELPESAFSQHRCSRKCLILVSYQPLVAKSWRNGLYKK